MRIALIGTTTSSMLAFRRELIQFLVATRKEVYIFCTDLDAEGESEIVRLGGVAVKYSMARSGLNPFADFYNFCSLYRKIKKLELDVVFCFFSKPVVFGTLAAAVARVPRRVAMLEGLGYTFTKKPEGSSSKTTFLKFIQLQLYRISFGFLSELIFLNKDDRDELLEKVFFPSTSVTVLGGIGVDLSVYKYHEPPIDPVNFIFVGRLLREKGVREFFEAASLVKASYPQANFFVAGGLDNENPGGLTSSELDEFVRSGIVSYEGQVKSVLPLLVKSSVFVLPSYREGVPKSTQEALAVGRAVITTDVPGCRDTVLDGVNGFLVSPGKAKEIAEKMIFFISHPSAIVAMGRKSREFAEINFDVDVVNLRLAALITGEPND